MTEKTENTSGCPQWCSVTGLCTFRRCPRKYMYQQVQRLCGASNTLALKYGEAIHAGVPWMYEGSVGKAMDAFGKVWTVEDDAGDEKRNSQRAKKLFEKFGESHRSEGRAYDLITPPPSGLEIDDRVSAWEVPFAVDIGIEVPLVGRIDGLGKARGTEELWGVEFKTSSEMGSRFMNAFEMSPQLMVYTFALRALGRSVVGCYLEGMLVSKVKSESLTIPVRFPKAYDEHVVRWVSNTWMDIKHCLDSDRWDMNLAGCTPYPSFGSHGYECEYKPLCKALIETGSDEQVKGMYEKNDYVAFRVKAVGDQANA